MIDETKSITDAMRDSYVEGYDAAIKDVMKALNEEITKYGKSDYTRSVVLIQQLINELFVSIMDVQTK